MRSSHMKAALIFSMLALTVGTLSAQSGSVQVYTSRSGFEHATGARPLPFPASATVLPATPFANLHDYSCVEGTVGINLPTDSAAPLANIQAVSSDWICFIGEAWDGGSTNPQPQSPTIVANGEDDYKVKFASPVHAVGFELLTNSSATETITLHFTDGSNESFGAPETGPNGFHFVGFESTKPFAEVSVDTTDGSVQNEGIVAILAAFALKIDIKPCSEPSPVNLKSNGVVTAAILGSAELDVSLIDPATVTLQGLSPKEPGKSGKLLCRIEDIAGTGESCGPDGLPDLVCHFQMGESAEDLTRDIWTIRAETYSGVVFVGLDSVKVIIPPSLDKNDNNGKPDNPGNSDKVPPGLAKEKPGNDGNGNENSNGKSNGGKKP